MSGTSRTAGSSARISRLVLIVCTQVIAARALVHAQASPFVPLGAPVYSDLNLLANAGLIDGMAGSVRPYTRTEIRRLLAEARRNVDTRRGPNEWAELLIDRNLTRYSGSAKGIDYAALELSGMDSPDRPVPADFNGSIDAVVNPLAAWRGGQPIADGGSAFIETMHSVSVGSHVALSLNPLATVERERDGSRHAKAKLQTVSATFLFGNLLAEAGRDYVAFGPAPEGGLLLSMNAPPLDMARISTQRPANLPWIFRRLGPANGMLFVADLGADHQTHPHAKLVGYHMGFAPRSNVELGVEVIDETGGRGAPPASFTDRVLDAIPVFDALRTGSDFRFSNKLAGADARWRIPDWAGLELYVEGALDDLDIRRIRSSLLEDGGVIGGVSMACLVECGRFVVRLEYHQTGIRYYTHTDFASGIEAHGIMLGDPLGPRGIGGYAAIESDAQRLGKLTLSGGYEVRSGNLYGSAGEGSNSADFHFVQIEHRPAERRTRLLTTWTSRMQANHAEVMVSAGVERALNFGFSGHSRTSAMGRVAYQIWP